MLHVHCGGYVRRRVHVLYLQCITCSCDTEIACGHCVQWAWVRVPPEAANFSLKNDCFGRVVLCCFAFLLYYCCLAFLGISWSYCSCTIPGFHAEAGIPLPLPTENLKICIVSHSKQNLYSFILMHDTVVVLHKLLPPHQNILYEYLVWGWCLLNTG